MRGIEPLASLREPTHTSNGLSVAAFCFKVKKKNISVVTTRQCGITCGAIEEASRSSKAINERVIIHFCDKNAVIARFCDKNDVDLYDKMS